MPSLLAKARQAVLEHEQQRLGSIKPARTAPYLFAPTDLISVPFGRLDPLTLLSVSLQIWWWARFCRANDVSPHVR
jgi:hypothetical protein